MGVLASAASAAVVQKKPSSVYGANGTVRQIIIVGTTAYMGGQFTGMTPAGGTAVTRNHVAAINMTTGALLPWNPNANGVVYSLLGEWEMYIGGTFTSVGGATHKNLVEVNGSTGAPVTALRQLASPEQSGARAGPLRREPVRRRRVHDAAAVRRESQRRHRRTHPRVGTRDR